MLQDTSNNPLLSYYKYCHYFLSLYSCCVVVKIITIMNVDFLKWTNLVTRFFSLSIGRKIFQHVHLISNTKTCQNVDHWNYYCVIQVLYMSTPLSDNVTLLFISSSRMIAFINIISKKIKTCRYVKVIGSVQYTVLIILLSK